MGTTRPHTEACRRRIVDKLMQTDKGRRVIEREEERIAMRVQEEVEQTEAMRDSKQPEQSQQADGDVEGDVVAMALSAIRQVEDRAR